MEHIIVSECLFLQHMHRDIITNVNMNKNMNIKHTIANLKEILLGNFLKYK